MKPRNFLKFPSKGSCFFPSKARVVSRQLTFNSSQIILLLGLITFTSTKALSQTVLCGFNEYYDSLLVQVPQLKAEYDFNEYLMDFMFSENPMAITSCDVYTIPVVVHVIHPNESLGVGANITDEQIESAIEDLSAKFRNEHELSYDVCVEFCLAQRDPNGNPTTGINRINAYDVCINSICYQDVGIIGANDQIIKNLSRWPNTEYLNIWVVSEINGNDGGEGVQGYATFPGTPAEEDGIVIQYKAFGTVGNLNSFTDQNTVLLHEIGHFFFLYHTFQGDGDGSTCPVETDCHDDGDKLCETPPHKRSLSDCNTTGTNICDNNSTNEKFVHNYLDYSNEDCKYLFVEEQRNKMRCALMGPRAELSYSLGCMPPCSTVISSYTGGDVEIDVSNDIYFTNTSINGEHYIWRLNSEIVSTDEHLQYFFLDGGVFTLCLDAMNETCTNRMCTQITVLPLCMEPLSECEFVTNGNFEQIDADETTDPNDIDVVCGWDIGYSSPFFCAQPTNNAIGLFMLSSESNDHEWERIVTEERLDLETGSSYQLSFDYYVARYPVDTILVVLSANQIVGVQFPNGGKRIARIIEPDYDPITDLENKECYPEEAVFTHFSDCFEYNGDNRKYLSITGKSEFRNSREEFSLVYIDNVSVEKCNVCCIPVPDFTFTTDSCEVTFLGENSGDEGTYTWIFGDGTSGGGEEITHEYKWPGIYNVCLIISCDESPGEIICKEVEIQEYCDDCVQIPLITARHCSSDTTLEYITQFSFEIPASYNPCGSEFFIWSDDVSVINSYTIDSLDINTNLVDLNFTLTPIGTFDFDTDTAFVYVTFCDSTGEMICYQIKIVGGSCNNCYDIEEPVIASCNPELGDSISTFVYDGTFILDLGFNMEYWEALSPEVGFSIDNFTAISTTQWSFDFSITTNDIDFSGTTAIFVFKRENQPIYFCYKIQFDIDLPCPNIPTECKSNWTKSVMCSHLDDEGLVIFPTGLMSIPVPEGYTLCNNKPIVLIDDPYQVDVNGMEIIDDLLWFDIAIHADRDSFGRETFVRFIFCNDRGDTIVCQGIWFKLKCNLILPRSSEAIQVVRTSNSQLCSVFPNPVSETLEVLFNKPIQSGTSIGIVDVFGNFIHFERIPYLVEGISIDVGNYLPGLYFLLVMENGRVADTHKIAVIHP